MDHRNVSIQFLRATGILPVRVRPNQKDPFQDWEPRRAHLEDHEATLKMMAESNINIGGLFHGRNVDVDIDTKDPGLLNALDYFLPRTAYVWGRKSKPRSHRAYTLHEEFSRDAYSGILKFMKNLKIGDPKEGGINYSVEIRGGKIENGLMTVLPGSTHSGETVEWAGVLDPTVSGSFVPLGTLVSAVRMAQAVALILPYWGPGVRNEMSLALAGLFWRIRSRSMAALGIDMEAECGETQFLLTEDRARAMFTAIMELADDKHGDERQRMLNLQNSWKKLDADPSAKVSGGNVLAELMGAHGELIVKSLYRLLSDSEGLEQLEELCEKFCMWYGQGTLIDLTMVEKGIETPWMNKEQAANSLAGRKIKIGDKRIPVVGLMFGTALLQRVIGLTFDPSTTDRFVNTPQGVKINQWSGFEMIPCPQRVTDEEVRPFTEYVLNILAHGDTELAVWILNWCADLLQNPGNKPGTALVLVGPQGAGKTFLGERVLGPIIGKAHYIQVNKIESITDRFNSMTADNKIFVQCDEAIHSYQKGLAAQLKSLITDETITVEPKNVNSYKKPNHMHYLFTSNEESTAIFIDPTPHERRFTVSKVSAERAEDTNYWEDMRSWVENYNHKIMRWLLDRKFERKSIVRPYETKAKRDIQKVGVEPEISWILNRMATGFILSERSHEHWWQAFNDEDISDNDKKVDRRRRDVWPNTVHLPTLEDDFKAFVRAHGKTVYTGSVITNIKKALPEGSLEPKGQITVKFNDPRHGQETTSRIRTHTFPSEKEIHAALVEKYGEMIDAANTMIGDGLVEQPPEEEPLEY